MSDVRALLKAKRQEARVTHPLAAYTTSGQLRCIACGTAVKYASAWNGHVGSKAHRTSAAKLREEEAKRAQEEELQRARGKRKASEEDSGDEDEEDEEDAGHGSEESATKRRKLDDEGDTRMASPPQHDPHPPPSNGFPTDFFSDPAKAPPISSHDDSDDEVEQESGQVPPVGSEPTAIDLEWERFQQAMLNPSASEPDPQAAHETYQRATLVADPTFASEIPQGFPSRGQDPEQGEEPEPEVLDEEQLRIRKEQDERELIMDRLLDEERAQEEADAKVTLLKTRLDALKRRREAAKASKAKP